MEMKNRAGYVPRGFCLGVTPEASADTLTMQRDIQPFALFFLGHTQTNDNVRDLEEDPSGNRRIGHGGGHSDDLLVITCYRVVVLSKSDPNFMKKTVFDAMRRCEHKFWRNQ